jgi:UDP-N-acetylmuramoyl-L-alanyl-D-glutamate--2,6-diaminopimelate ligase
MAAVLVGREIGLSKAQIEKGIAALDGVEGRMMQIDEGQPFGAMIDHAGTPDAFERFFKTIRPQVKGKLVVVFGSPGRRDVAKRSIQGEIAGKYADEVILTEEDDRDESGEAIMNEMAQGAEKAGKVQGKDLFLIGNRTEAIEFAVSRVSGKEDMVVTLGKGQEKTIERADGTYAWSEPETMRVALRKSRKQ